MDSLSAKTRKKQIDAVILLKERGGAAFGGMSSSEGATCRSTTRLIGVVRVRRFRRDSLADDESGSQNHLIPGARLLRCIVSLDLLFTYSNLESEFVPCENVLHFC